MELVLRGLNWKICLIYLDDIICFSTSFPQHLDRLEEVFQALSDANLRLKPKKCVFAKSRVEFLGHVITKDGITPTPEKTLLIENFKPPKTAKQVKQFLGLTGYYRKFVPQYSQISLPLKQNYFAKIFLLYGFLRVKLHSNY